MDILEKFYLCMSRFTNMIFSSEAKTTFEEISSFLKILNPLWDNLCVSASNTDFDGIKDISFYNQKKIKIQSANNDNIIFEPKECIYIQSNEDLKENAFLIDTKGKLSGLEKFILPEQNEEENSKILIYPWNSYFAYSENKLELIEKIFEISLEKKNCSENHELNSFYSKKIITPNMFFILYDSVYGKNEKNSEMNYKLLRDNLKNL
jgi:hypothetical protein